MPPANKRATIPRVGEQGQPTGLAPIYERALDLRNVGASHEVIAVATGVDVEAVPALLDLADRKHARRQGAMNQPTQSHQAVENRGEPWVAG